MAGRENGEYNPSPFTLPPSTPHPPPSTFHLHLPRSAAGCCASLPPAAPLKPQPPQHEHATTSGPCIKQISARAPDHEEKTGNARGKY
jgi:hypothetical protein